MPTYIILDDGPEIEVESFDVTKMTTINTSSGPQRIVSEIVVRMDLQPARNYGIFQKIFFLSQKGSAHYNKIELEMVKKTGSPTDGVVAGLDLKDVDILEARTSPTPDGPVGELVLTTKVPAKWWQPPPPDFSPGRPGLVVPPGKKMGN